MSRTHNLVTSDKVFEALVASGALDIINARRVVIDLQVGHVAIMHVEYFGDVRLLEVVQTLDGIEIQQSEATS